MTIENNDQAEIDRAAQAIRDGECVMYPTETVYGLGCDALNPVAIERAFELKGRSREKPISLAVPDLSEVGEYTRPSEREVAFMEEFLPGPVTVVLAARSVVPPVLTAGRDRVGVRIPDHPVALELLSHVNPITATSANRSGAESARRIEEIDPEIRERVACLINDGETPGGGSTVVDISNGVIHRRGPLADEIEEWM